MADRRSDDTPPPSDASDGRVDPPSSEESSPEPDDTDAADAGDSASGADGGQLEALHGRLVSFSLWQVVTAITVVALLARLIGLGTRPMHYDEARVGYWILHYVESRSFHYMHGIHGPFIQQVNHWLFPLVGASDFVARLPVALAGGLLPLVALLFRKHLQRSETVAVALFLGFNSVVLYYSRYMRSDILLAAFMFAAFGLLVRLYDTRDARYLYGVALLGAFGFASKENAIVYVVTWIGATGLLVDQALFRPRAYRTGFEATKEWVADLRSAGRDLLPSAGHAAGALVVFLAVLVFMYADRGAGMAGIEAPRTPPSEGAVGLWEALGNPTSFPGYAYETLATSADEAFRWGGRTGVGESEDLIDTYVSHIGTDLEVLWSNGLVLMVFAVLGFIWERYGRERSRNLVLFASYCGFVSVLGYPLADDIGSAHWLNVHILVPLAIPAAVGIAGVYRWGRDGYFEGDQFRAIVVATILVFAGIQVAMAAGTDVYGDTTSQDNPIAQYAQPQSEFDVVVEAINEVTGSHNGTDVVVYTGASFEGDRRIVDPPSASNHSFVLRPACVKSAWYNAIPVHWYLTKGNASVACETNPDALTSMAATEEPALILTRETDSTVPASRLESAYVARTFDVYQFQHEFTIYLHEDRVDDVPGWETADQDPAS
ncbi:MAG: hypothetical protein ACI8XM_001659 [Haloarculaceae archaeon]|jgi:uncharacterized protein (TIGR03663 family)